MIKNFSSVSYIDIGGNPEDSGYAFESYEYLFNTGEGTIFLVPLGISGISCQLCFTGGAIGKIQTTMSNLKQVKDNNAEWEDWPYGDISSNTHAQVYLVSAIRCYKTNNLGRITFVMRAQ